MKHARLPVKVQNERRMASFLVWMAWWCRAVLMHRTRWSFLETQRDKKSKRQRVKETKSQRDEETKSQRDEETKSQRDGETERRGVKESKRRREFEQGLFNGWCCFSWKAWQKIRMRCAEERQGSILHSFELFFSCIFKQVSSAWRRKR